MNKRVVNCRFICCGLHFDAAVDCDWDLHYYDQSEEERRNVTPIELYCFDKPEWDIRMMYHKEKNDAQRTGERLDVIVSTCVDIDAIKKEARKWVREMVRRKKV